MVLVTAAAVDTATQGEIAAAQAAKKSQKAAEKAAKDKPKLQKGKINPDGKFTILSYVAADGMWVYYILQEGLKRERLYDVTAKALISQGRAITINREEYNKMSADKKSAEKAVKKQAAENKA